MYISAQEKYHIRCYGCGYDLWEISVTEGHLDYGRHKEPESSGRHADPPSVCYVSPYDKRETAYKEYYSKKKYIG